MTKKELQLILKRLRATAIVDTRDHYGEMCGRECKACGAAATMNTNYTYRVGVHKLSCAYIQAVNILKREIAQ